MKTVALARSRERSAIVVVEQFNVEGQYDRLRLLQHAERLSAGASAVEEYERLIAVSDAAQAGNFTGNGSWEEPKLIVLLTMTGRAVFDLLLDAYRDRPRRRRYQPQGVSVTGGADGYFDPALLMARLNTNWHRGLIQVAPDLPDREQLRRQLTSFRPIETKTGKFEVGSELSMYDDVVVALALATYGHGRGVERHIDSEGQIRRPGAVVGRAS